MEKTMDEVKNRVGENFNEIREGLNERTQELRDAVSSYVEENPLAAVGIAFGVGYLLSGALFSRTTFRAASYGGRFVVGRFLRQLVAGIGPGILLAAVGGREEAEGAPSREGGQAGGEPKSSGSRSAGNGGQKAGGNGNKPQG